MNLSSFIDMAILASIIYASQNMTPNSRRLASLLWLAAAIAAALYMILSGK